MHDQCWTRLALLVMSSRNSRSLCDDVIRSTAAHRPYGTAELILNDFITSVIWTSDTY